MTMEILPESTSNNSAVVLSALRRSDMGDDVDINMLTMEQYLALIQDKIRPGVVKPEIGNDVKFEINSNFMRELRRKLFKGTDDEDAYEHHDLNSQQKVHILYTGLDIPTRILLDSKGFIPLMTPTQALKSIQVRADHSCNCELQDLRRVHLTNECTLKKEDKAVVQNLNLKALDTTTKNLQVDDRDMDNGWGIMVMDVERLRQMLTPTVYTLPNLELVVQLYMPIGPVCDEAKVERKRNRIMIFLYNMA
ncbi:hypothetical protein Tco_1234347 [Tanacetum coccineum]